VARDPYRISRILDLLRKYWAHHPDLRLGQLVGDFAGHNSSGGRMDSYYLEDDLLEQRLREAMKEKGSHGMSTVQK